MNTLVISCSQVGRNDIKDLDYELHQLANKAKEYCKNIYLLNPIDLEFIVRPEQKIVETFYKEESISQANALIVRSTQGCEEATRMMALSLYSQGCELLDPVERFNGSLAGKAVMSIRGMKDNSLPTTYIAYNFENAKHMLSSHIDEKQFPLVGKPSIGGRGKNVELLKNRENALLYAKTFFKNTPPGTAGILFQKYIDIQDEYRVLLLDSEVLGMVKKGVSDNSFGRNASNGSKFTAADDETIGEYAKNNASTKGLIGVDVAVDTAGKIFIIESNRAPQWQEFEKASGIDVASRIFERLEKKLEVTSELF